jgi:glycosyltransferase involved in cell wall biosynthesis
MKILIGIATFQRPEKLQRLLESLKNQTHQDFEVCVAFDNNDTNQKGLRNWDRAISTIRLDYQGYVVGCWNRIHALRGSAESKSDAHLMLCDDVELFPDCLEIACRDLANVFPDTDGVIGLTQECPGRGDYSYKPFGQTLMGGKFLERYSRVGYKLCCPYFHHFFQDEEMYIYAASLRKFYHSPEAKLYHYHPAFKPAEMDSTHKLARIPTVFQHDVDTFKRRQSSGRLWGKNWDE